MLSTFHVTWTFHNQFPGKRYDQEINVRIGEYHNLYPIESTNQIKGDAGSIREFMRYYTYSKDSKQLTLANVSIFDMNPHQFSRLSEPLWDLLPFLSTFKYSYLYDRLTTSPFSDSPETITRCLKIMSFLREKDEKSTKRVIFSGGASDVNFRYKWYDW